MRTRSNRGFAVLVSLLLTSATNAQEAPLAGRVATSRGEPLVGALVTAERDGDVLATARTEGTGAFRFAALPSSAIVLRATTSDRVAAIAITNHLRTGSFVPMFAGPAQALRGTVRDAQGAPIAGAWVAAIPTGSRDLACYGTHTTSAADGAFTLDAMPIGPVALRAYSLGHAPGALQVERPDEAPLVLRCNAAPAPPHRIVLDGFTHEQLASARLHVTTRRNDVEIPLPAWLASPPRGADGNFVVAAAHPFDDLRARLEVDGAMVEPERTCFAFGASGDTRTFTPVAGDATPVHGRVELVSGELPPDGVQLLLESGGQTVPVRTDARGTFTSPAALARNAVVRVQVKEPGFTLALPIAGPFPHLRAPFQDRNHPDHPLQMLLMRSATLRGRALDEHGGPVASARVHLMFGGPGLTHTVRGGDVPSSGQIAIGCTDAEGRFELVDVTPWPSMMLQITGPTGTLAQLTDLEADERRDLGTLQLGPAASVHGVVRDAEGKPQPGAWLRVEIWSGACHEFVMAADADGAFVLPGLPVGRALIARLGSRQAVNVELCAGERSEVPPLPQ